MQADGVAPVAAAPAAAAPAAVPAVIAPAAGDAQPQYVFIKRAGGAAADDEVYAEVAILPGDTVARLAERACAKFGWGMPSQASLFLVDHLPGGDEPSALVEAKATTPSSRRLQSGWTLERAGVGAGSWLLARVPPPAAAAAPAGGAGTAVGAGGLGIVEALEALELELKDVKKETLELKEELKEEMKKETLGLKEAMKKETLGLKEELSAQIALTGYNASHALTMVSKDKLNRGALFRVHDESGVPLFCSFFVDERVALTISHDKLFEHGLPISVSGCSASGRRLTFDVVSIDTDLDFSVLRLAEGCAPAAAFFSLQGFSDVEPGLGIAIVTMGIGSSAAVGEEAYAVHKASITSVNAKHILYDGAETWAGDSGGALLFEDGFVIGMHLEVFDAKPAVDGAPPLPAAGATAKRARLAADAAARTANALEQLSVASSSHGKVCRALRLTHSRVLSAVESARHIPTDSLRAGAGTS